MTIFTLKELFAPGNLLAYWRENRAEKRAVRTALRTLDDEFKKFEQKHQDIGIYAYNTRLLHQASCNTPSLLAVAMTEKIVAIADRLVDICVKRNAALEVDDEQTAENLEQICRLAESTVENESPETTAQRQAVKQKTMSWIGAAAHKLHESGVSKREMLSLGHTLEGTFKAAVQDPGCKQDSEVGIAEQIRTGLARFSKPAANP